MCLENVYCLWSVLNFIAIAIPKVSQEYEGGYIHPRSPHFHHLYCEILEIKKPGSNRDLLIEEIQKLRKILLSEIRSL